MLRRELGVEVLVDGTWREIGQQLTLDLYAVRRGEPLQIIGRKLSRSIALGSILLGAV